MNGGDSRFVEYLSGLRLYGEELSPEEIDEWLRDEENAYAVLGSSKREEYQYGYHALNQRYGYRYLGERRLCDVLAFGGAYGDELLPLLPRIEGSVTIVESSNSFFTSSIGSREVSYMKARGELLPFSDDSFDLITCLGVLHHLPRIRRLLREFHRCLRPSGFLLLREPTVSLGDWRQARKGLTPRERGIPLALLRREILGAGFSIKNEKRCMFSLTPRLARLVGAKAYNSLAFVIVDSLLCSVFSFNKNYHPASQLQKLRPTSVFYVLRKGEENL